MFGIVTLASVGLRAACPALRGNPDLGLLAHWALNESQPGSTAADSSGFGNDGLPSQNPPVPTYDVPPVRFQDPFSLSFNGQDQWIEIGNPNERSNSKSLAMLLMLV